MRDRLFLLHPDFEDPAYPGRRFYCWHCALMEGVLASFPRLLETIDVHRVDWPRPRREVADLLGEDNQSLPVLVAASDAPDSPETLSSLIRTDDDRLPAWSSSGIRRRPPRT